MTMLIESSKPDDTVSADLILDVVNGAVPGQRTP